MAKKPGTSLVTMKDLEAAYAVEAQEASAAVNVGGMPMISTRDSTFACNDVELKEPLQLIVLAEGLVNAWYDSEWNPDGTNAPACFAVALAKKGAEEAMVAHESSPDRQGGVDHRCQGCEMNQFGSAERGNGKACSNTRKLAVVFADDPALKDPSLRPNVALLSIPPTGLVPWGKYVQSLDKVVHRPPHGVVTSFGFNRRDPNERNRKAVIPLSFQPIDNVGVAQAVNRFRKEVIDDGLLTRPLPVDGYVKPDQKQKPARSRQAPAKQATKGATRAKAAKF